MAARTARENQLATQNDARMDTARLMAIYGTRLAIQGTPGATVGKTALPDIMSPLASPWTFENTNDGRL